MTQLTDIEMAFRDALWEEIGSHADMTIGELNLAVHRTLTALEARGLVIEQGWQPIETAMKCSSGWKMDGQPPDQVDGQTFSSGVGALSLSRLLQHEGVRDGNASFIYATR